MRSISMSLHAICISMILSVVVLYPHAIAAQSLAGSQDLTGSVGMHDPCTIIKSNGTYYTWGTGGGCLTSTDRHAWKSISFNPTSRQSWWAAHGGQMWAPDITFKNGVYYCYYSVSASKNFNSAIGVSASPTIDPSTAKWTDLGIVIDSTQAADGGKMVNVIDASTFTDDDGKWYMCFGSFQNGCRMAELNPGTGKLMNVPPHPTVISNKAGEASAICHWKNYYYYAISEGHCCDNMKSTYYISYGRATSVKGPYLNKAGGSMQTSAVEKLLRGSNNQSATSGVVACGVSGFFWDGNKGLDTLFMDYMGYTAPGGGAQLYIKPLYADDSGWLTFESSKGTVITRSTSTMLKNGFTGLTNANKQASGLARICLMRNSMRNKPIKELYNIRGQRCLSKVSQLSKMGIFIEKR